MASEIKRIGDLEISEDMRFQERSWRVQRIGWVVMAIIIITALLGLFGGGPISRATAGTEADPLWVDYDRFSRLLKTTNIQVYVRPEMTQNGEVRLWISQDYLDKVEISHSMPTENNTEVSGDGIFYTFQVSKSSQPVPIIIYLRAVKAGLISGEIGLEGEASQEFTQFIYP